jgi:hypothetical protein
VKVAALSFQLPGAAVRVAPTTARPEIVGAVNELSGGADRPIACTADGWAAGFDVIVVAAADVETDTCAWVAVIAAACAGAL